MVMGMHVHNLACARGGITVLEGVGFSVLPGKALVLRGPNGIGKTTLAAHSGRVATCRGG